MPSSNPFTGTWKFRSDRSKLTTPAPRRWVQFITATNDAISIRERIRAVSGAPMTVTIQAKFDGRDYPVLGSAIADVIAYQRIDDHTISGVGKIIDEVSLKESITVSPDGCTLTVVFSLFTGIRETASGTAVFEKAQPQDTTHTPDLARPNST